MSLHDKEAYCPHDSTHKEFVTLATVTEVWVVDASGNFLSTMEDADRQTVVHGPTEGNIWACNTCFTEAQFRPVRIS